MEKLRRERDALAAARSGSPTRSIASATDQSQLLRQVTQLQIVQAELQRELQLKDEQLQQALERAGYGVIRPAGRTAAVGRAWHVD